MIVNWNGGRWLARLLDSLLPLRTRLRAILVVDNQSADGSADEAAARSGVTLIRNPGNLGFAGAANLGIRSTAAPFVLLLNPDLEIFPDALPRLYEAAAADPRAAITCGVLVDEAGVPQSEFQFRPLPTLGSVVRDAWFVDELEALLRLPRHRNVPADLLQPAAAFWLMRREAWVDLGGFDEQFYPAWFEDVDFCRRLLAVHWRIRVVPEPCAAHVGGYSVSHLGTDRFLDLYYGNLLKYWRKHHHRTLVPVWAAVQSGRLMRRWVRRS